MAYAPPSLSGRRQQPHLSSYHILTPDLPAHSSSQVTTFTISPAASLVASLIKSHAHSIPCHVVGLSAGGFVALVLAKAHPQLVQTLCGRLCGKELAYGRGAVHLVPLW